MVMQNGRSGVAEWTGCVTCILLVMTGTTWVVNGVGRTWVSTFFLDLVIFFFVVGFFKRLYVAE